VITRLVQKVNVNGEEKIACVFYGTQQCHNIHNKDVSGCFNCPMMAAIMNKLYLYEEIEHEGEQD
jgi:hypothetical protein